MFKFLKDKLKSAAKKFSKDIEEEAEDIEVPEEEIQEVEKTEPEKPKSKKPKKRVEKKVPEEKAEKKAEKTKERKKKEKGVKKKEKETKPEEKVSEEEPDTEKRISEKTEEKKDSDKEEKEEKEILGLTPEPPEVPEGEEPEDVKKRPEEKKEVAEEKEPEKEEVEEGPEELEEKPEKKGFFSRLFKKKEKPEEVPGTPGPAEEKEAGAPEKPEEKVPERPEEEKKEEAEKEEEKKIERLEEKEKEEEAREEEEKKELSEEDKLIKDIDDDKEEVLEDLAEDDEALEKRGFFGKLKEKVSGKKLSESKFEDLFFDLEIALLENNVAVEVIEKIKEDLKGELVDKKLNRFEIERIIMKTLRKSLDNILSFEKLDILKKIGDKKDPFSIVFVGINGSGKTTTIAKMARYFMDNGLKVVLVASDTFRAAAIQQLEEHAKKLDVKLIKHDYGSDPAAVAFDGIRYAKQKGIDVVLIDTAGRLHSNINLMDEMRKIIRVSEPDMKIFIGESITGNDCVEQAQKFNETIGLDGIVLSKADVDEKGGAAISVSYVTGRPILFLGTGQEYKDLTPFDKKLILSNLGLQ